MTTLHLIWLLIYLGHLFFAAAMCLLSGLLVFELVSLLHRQLIAWKSTRQTRNKL